jgi:hypothetical protein
MTKDIVLCNNAKLAELVFQTGKILDWMAIAAKSNNLRSQHSGASMLDYDWAVSQSL